MPQPCRIALITTVPMSLAFFRGQPSSLRDHGYEVHAVTAPGPELEAFAAAEGVPAHGIPMTRQITPRRDLVALARLTVLLARLRPTIVHASTPKGGLLGMVAARLTRRPVRIFHLHGMPHQTRTGLRRALLKGTTRIACTLADEVICVGPSLRDEAVREGICAREKAVVLVNGSANGVDADGQFNPLRFGPTPRLTTRGQLGLPNDALIVGFIGRLAHDKGIDDLAAAWRHLRLRFPTAHLLLVGPEEPDDPASPETLAVLREDERVHFTGRLADPAAALAAMDVLTLPTYREGLPTVLIEANAMEIPVVATTVTGCVDAIVPGRTGLLVPPHAPGELAAAIGRYLDDPELRARHGAEGRRRALRDFDPAAMRTALREFYDRHLAANGISPPSP